MPGYDDLIGSVATHEVPRTEFLKACLTKLGLEVNRQKSLVPSLSKLHLSSISHTEVGEFVHSFGDLVTKDKGEDFICGENDTFYLENRDSRWSMLMLVDAILPDGASKTATSETIDYSRIVKRIVSHNEAWPETKETPYFNHADFYSSLRDFRGVDRQAKAWGDIFMYGEVVTSTNTLLEK